MKPNYVAKMVSNSNRNPILSSLFCTGLNCLEVKNRRGSSPRLYSIANMLK
jgi:hypothetical protein